jgi:hypothetical protein
MKRKLLHYFESHPIQVVTLFGLREIIENRLTMGGLPSGHVSLWGLTLGGHQYLHSPGHKEGISLGEAVHAAQAYLLSSSTYFGHTWLAGISPPGELTIMRHLSMAIGILCLSTYAPEINECDIPESNMTIAVVELIENISRTTSGAS